MKGTIRPSHVNNNPRMSMQQHPAKQATFDVQVDFDIEFEVRQAFDWRSVVIGSVLVGMILFALVVVAL